MHLSNFNKIASIVSIFVYLCLVVGSYLLADAIGLTVRISYEDTVVTSHRYWEEESNGHYTDLGWFIFIVSGMLAWRIYHWVASGRLDGNISKKSHRSWLIWITGMSTYIFSSTLLSFVVLNNSLLLILQLLCAVIIFWFGWKYNKSI